jgi:hypothetical protein
VLKPAKAAYAGCHGCGRGPRRSTARTTDHLPGPRRTRPPPRPGRCRRHRTPGTQHEPAVAVRRGHPQHAPGPAGQDRRDLRQALGLVARDRRPAEGRRGQEGNRIRSREQLASVVSEDWDDRRVDHPAAAGQLGTGLMLDVEVARREQARVERRAAGHALLVSLGPIHEPPPGLRAEAKTGQARSPPRRRAAARAVGPTALTGGLAHPSRR